MSDFQKFLDENLSKIKFEKTESEKKLPDYDIYGEIREMIVSERRKQKITQKELARRSGISQANICNIEKGERCPTIDTLKKIGDALGKRLVISFEDREDVL